MGDLPVFVNGLLPPSLDGQPYDLTQDQVEEAFVTDPARRTAWSCFLEVRHMLSDLLSIEDAQWWLHGRFVTAAAEVDIVDAKLVLSWPTSEDAHSAAQHTLLRVAGDRQALQSLRTRLQLVRMSDEHLFAIERRRCSRNVLHEGEELRDAGWVRLL